MSAKSANRKSVVVLLLLLLFPAYDGVKRANLSAIYAKDFEALVTSLRLNIPLDPNTHLPNDSAMHQADESTGSDNIANENTANDMMANEQTGDSNIAMKDMAAIANNEFNLARSHCGLNTLTEESELQAVALNHANYINYVFANSTPTRFNPHYQIEIADIANVTSSNNPYFSGLDVKNRMFNASYANRNYGITENIAQTMYYHSAGRLISPTVATISMAKSLLAAPYHLRSLMVPSSKVVGTAVVGYKPYAKDERNNQGYVLVSNAAATKATRNAKFSGVFTYPCEGISGTVTGLYNETPDPVRHTGRNLSTDPIGQPIYINVPSARRIDIRNVRFYDNKRDISLPTQVLNHLSDPYKNTEFELPANEAFILPLTDSLNSCETIIRKAKNCGLHGHSEYQVSFDIIIDNKRMQHQSFSFLTGEINQS